MKWREGDGEAWKGLGSLDDKSDVHIRVRAIGVRFKRAMKGFNRALKKASAAFEKLRKAMERGEEDAD